MKLITLLCVSIAVLFSLASYSKCHGKPVTIGVIDTGFGFLGRGGDATLCPVGHKDFTIEKKFFTEAKTKDPVPMDMEGHGTNILGIIEDYAKAAHINFCIVVLKYHPSLWVPGNENLESTVRAINYATALKLDFINYSSGGTSPADSEREAVEKYLNAGGTLVVAAGNEGVDLDDAHNTYYPAEYDKRIIVVGMLDDNGVKSSVSNYGSPVNRWEKGFHITGYGLTMSGTSQATATATGKLVSQQKNRCE